MSDFNFQKLVHNWPSCDQKQMSGRNSWMDCTMFLVTVWPIIDLSLKFKDRHRAHIIAVLISPGLLLMPQKWPRYRVKNRPFPILGAHRALSDPGLPIGSQTENKLVLNGSREEFLLSPPSRHWLFLFFQTKSTRSIRSVTRSDHGHRVDPREVCLQIFHSSKKTKNFR